MEGRGACALYRAAGVDTRSLSLSLTTRQVALLFFLPLPPFSFLSFFSSVLIFPFLFLFLYLSNFLFLCFLGCCTE